MADSSFSLHELIKTAPSRMTINRTIPNENKRTSRACAKHTSPGQSSPVCAHTIGRETDLIQVYSVNKISLENDDLSDETTTTDRQPAREGVPYGITCHIAIHPPWTKKNIRTYLKLGIPSTHEYRVLGLPWWLLMDKYYNKVCPFPADKNHPFAFRTRHVSFYFFFISSSKASSPSSTTATWHIIAFIVCFPVSVCSFWILWIGILLARIACNLVLGTAAPCQKIAFDGDMKISEERWPCVRRRHLIQLIIAEILIFA